MEYNSIYQGNSLELGKKLEDESVQCIVTSPPYFGLRDYGIAGQFGAEKSPEEYVCKIVELFRELRRALRSNGTVWLNLGDSYAGSGTGGGGNRKGNEHGQHDAMKGIGRPKVPNGLKPKDLIGIPWLVAFALRADGWYLRNEIIWEKPNVMPSSVTDRLTVSHEQIFLLSKSPKYYYDIDAIREPHQSFDKRNITERSQKYRGKFNTSNLETVNSPRAHAQRDGYNEGSFYNPKGRNRRTVWHVNTKPLKEAHFATFPPDLIFPCILAGCPEGGVVLDPFMGAGTTAVVAKSLRRNYIGFELNPEYIAIAGKRIANTPSPLFVSDTKATFTKPEIVVPKMKQGKLL